MAKDIWLPRGYELTDGRKILALLFSGDDWQIYNTSGLSNILIVRPELVNRWCDTNFSSDSLFNEIMFGTTTFQYLICPSKYMLAPVESMQLPDSKVDAIAFSCSLKESRKLSADVSFHDAIYVEQYSRLLPTWTLTPHVEDEVILGTWLTGGVVVSTKSFRRLSNLTGWMPPGDIVEIINAAGFHVPAEAMLLTICKPKSRKPNDEKLSTTEAIEYQGEPQSPSHKSASKGFTLPGRPQLEAFFNEHVIDIIFNPEKYQVLGIDFPSAIVLHGPPGCGKTYAVERLVDYIDWPSYSIDSNSVGSPYIHETSKKISEIFDKAIDASPSVIVIDEMESFLSNRRSGGTSGLHHVEEVAEFLRRIPEALKNKVLVIAMTNMIDLIDPAILRCGRFDHIIEVGMPSRIEVEELLDSLLCKLPKSEDIDISTMLDNPTGRALSDSAFVIREAARLAAKTGKTKIDQESISAAIKSLPKESEKKIRRIGFGRES